MKLIGVFPSAGLDQSRGGSFSASNATTRLERQSQCTARYPLGRGQSRNQRQTGGGNGRARARDNRGLRQLGCGGVAPSDPQRAGGVRGGPLTRLAPAMLRAWRGRVATLPAFCCLNTVLAGKWLELHQSGRPPTTPNL